MDQIPSLIESDMGPYRAQSSVELKRIDASRNMRRYYHMSLQPDLFGGVDLVREWGRIGRRGQFLIERHPDEQSALGAMKSRESLRVRTH